MEKDKKHRHDGTSPLPLGMDWSPPPKSWEGRCTVWPHDPRTGWSFCVMIPSWVTQPESESSSSFLNTVIFFRVMVGVQSPEGISASRGVLRRFSDFLNLFYAVKRTFPGKNIPPAPSKNSLFKVNASRLLLEERRCALEEWIGKLLSDIDLSRSIPVATFLELEAAARSYATVADSTTPSGQGQVSISEFRTAELECIHSLNSPRNSVHTLPGDNAEFGTEKIIDRSSLHARNLSIESTGSSYHSRDDSFADGSFDLSYGAEAFKEASGLMEKQSMNGVCVVHPDAQRLKLKKILFNMQQRLVTAKTDMENLIAQLNQETTVKEYLKTKVKDLEMELESAKHKSKVDLQQAILLERERVTQIQWDTDEFRRKYMDMETMIKFEQSEITRLELERESINDEKKLLLQELEHKTEQLKDLQKRYEELQIKSRSDTKILVKEIKLLRNSQEKAKEDLNQYLKEKNELEKALQKERQRRKRINLMRKRLLDACGVLRHRLQESSVNFFSEGEEKFKVDSSSLRDALGLLATSDTRISLLLEKAQALGQDDGATDDLCRSESNKYESISGDYPKMTSDDEMEAEDEIRKLLSDTIIKNALLRKQINSVVRCALKTILKPVEEDSGEAPSKKNVLDKLFGR